MNKPIVTYPQGWIEDGPGFNASKAVTTDYVPLGPLPIPDKGGTKPTPTWKPAY